MRDMSEPRLDPAVAPFVVDAARASAAVANYCDHAEHNEATRRQWVTDAALQLRQLSLKVAAFERVDLVAMYADRLRSIEGKSPLSHSDSFDGGERVASARTWRDLQLAQIEHDRVYHPDVCGLSKGDQLRHYALHLSKITGALAGCAVGEVDATEIRCRRLPDMLLFGLKLSTVMGERLAEEPFPQTESVAAEMIPLVVR